MKRIQSVGSQINQIGAVGTIFPSLPDVRVKDFVQNITQLRLDIGSSVNISEETVSTLLEASVSHSEVKDQKEVSN